MDLITKHTQAARECIEKAFKMFNITHIKASDVAIRNDIRGKHAGQARWRTQFGESSYSLRFNPEAINNYFQEMINDTIPHEVAHIVCFIRPELGKNHDAGWKRVCRMLGGDDSRTHTMNLSAGKQKTEYDYLVGGEIVKLGPKRHARLQRGEMTYRHRTLGKITKEMFVGKSGPQVTATPKAKPKSTAKAKPTTIGSKKQMAMEIYKANPNATRQQVIAMFMSHLSMTKAGASTYYYNCQKEA